MSKYDKDLYDWYKDNHICPTCGCRKSAPNRVRCEECLAKNANRKQKKMNPNAQKRNRERKKAQGKCINCGKPLSKFSVCFCLDCRIKNQRNNRKNRGGLARSERPSYGMCYICGDKIENGKVCEICKERCVKNLPKNTKETSWYLNNKRQNNLIFK